MQNNQDNKKNKNVNIISLGEQSTSINLNNITPYTQGQGESSLITPFAGTKRGEEIIKQNKENFNAILSKPQLAKEQFEDDISISTAQAFSNILTANFRDNSLTGALYRKLTRPIVADKDALTDEEFKNSPYYLEGMKFPSYNINYAEQKKMYNNMKDREFENNIALLSSTPQKVARFLTEIPVSIAADPLVVLGEGFIGVASKTITAAVTYGALSNVILDEAINQVNKEFFANEGINKTVEERNYERLAAALFGGVFAGSGKAIGIGIEKYKNKIKKPEQNIEDINTTIETDQQNQTIVNQDINYSDLPKEEIILKPELTKREKTLALFAEKEKIKTENKQAQSNIKIDEVKAIEEERRKTAAFKTSLRKGLTTPEQIDLTTNILQAKNMLQASVDFNTNQVNVAETNLNKQYTKTNETINGIYLPEKLVVNGLPNNTLNVKYKVVDLNSLIYSNKPNGEINLNYPQKYQPRDRQNDLIGLQTIIDNAYNLDPNKLIYDAGGITSGAPVIIENGVVISGNGRSMSLELAYANNKTDNYINELKTKFSHYDYSNINKPVLVREITDQLTEKELLLLAKRTNVEQVDSYTALENIKIDASTLLENQTILLYKGGDLTSKDNLPFISEFFKDLPNTQLKKYLNNENLTLDGYKKIDSAIVYAAYENDKLVSQMYIDLKNDIKKTLVNSLIDVAPKLIELKRLIKQQITDPEFDISKNISDAFDLIYTQDKELLKTFLNDPVFNREFKTNPITETIVRGFFKNENTFDKLLTQNDIILFLNNYLDSALKTRSIGLFAGDIQQSKPKNLLDNAKGNKEKIVIADEEITFDSQATSVEQIKIENAVWSSTRTLTKGTQETGYRGMQSATKQNIITEAKKLKEELGLELTKTEEVQFYKDEANILNLALFKKLAKDFREEYPEVSLLGKNQRDFATLNELNLLLDIQGKNTELINKNIPLLDRAEELYIYSQNKLNELNKSNPEGAKYINNINAIEQEIFNAKKTLNVVDYQKYKNQLSQAIDGKNSLEEYINCTLTNK